jgi:carbon monoxide dehydrogenase subunit G
VPEIVATRDLPVAPERAWAALTDWAGQRTWMPATRVRAVQGAGDRVGDRIVARTALGPVGVDDPMQITLWRPPERCHVRHLGRIVRGTGAFEVLATDGGCRVTWAEFLVAPGGAAGAAALAALARVGRAFLLLALRRLSARLAAA